MVQPKKKKIKLNTLSHKTKKGQNKPLETLKVMFYFFIKQMYQVVLKRACFLIIKLTMWSKMLRHLIYALANCHTYSQL